MSEVIVKNKVNVKNFEDTNPLYQLEYLVLEEVERLNSLRLGKILTVIDATIADQQQRKAIKDILKEQYYSLGDCDRWGADVKQMLFEFINKYTDDIVDDNCDESEHNREIKTYFK